MLIGTTPQLVMHFSSHAPVGVRETAVPPLNLAVSIGSGPQSSRAKPTRSTDGSRAART
jgi:hypothetical protein